MRTMRPLHVALATGLFLFAAALAPAGTVSEDARALWARGNPEEAEKALAAALASAPADGAARLLLGEIQAWDGRPDDAIATWTGALAGKPEDAPLLLAAARLHLQRIADGPWKKRRRGNVEMSVEALTGGDPKVAEAFTNQHRQSAEDCFRKAVAAAPGDVEATLALADQLTEGGKAAEAIPLYTALAKKQPKSVPCLVGWAAALMATGKRDVAKAKLDQALKLAPRDPQVHGAFHEWFKAGGTKTEADAATSLRKAQLFGWLPDFSKLEFSDALYERAKTLSTDPFWAAKSQEEAESMHAAKKTIVDELLAKKDAPSFDLLACIVWNHCCHGALEDAAMGALESRGAVSVPLLKRMLEESGSSCTKGSAARALARMKEATAFETVARMLASDVDAAWPMDIAEALRLYADPRAVPYLAAAVQPDAPPLPPPPKTKGRGRTVVVGGPPGSEGGMPDGALWARARAALALGEFPGDEARAALVKGSANPDVGPFCHAVLWRLTGDEKAHGKFVADAVRSGSGLGPMLLGPYLERIDHPNAKVLLDEWKKASEPAGKK